MPNAAEMQASPCVNAEECRYERVGVCVACVSDHDNAGGYVCDAEAYGSF